MALQFPEFRPYTYFPLPPDHDEPVDNYLMNVLSNAFPLEFEQGKLEYSFTTEERIRVHGFENLRRYTLIKCRTSLYWRNRITKVLASEVVHGQCEAENIWLEDHNLRLFDLVTVENPETLRSDPRLKLLSERSYRCSDRTRLSSSPYTGVRPKRILSLQVKAMSHDAVCNPDHCREYVPNPVNALDRILAVGVVETTESIGSPLRSVARVFELGPESSMTSSPLETVSASHDFPSLFSFDSIEGYVAATETELLEQFWANFQQYDPDMVVIYPGDFFHDFHYLLTRTLMMGLPLHGLDREAHRKPLTLRKDSVSGAVIKVTFHNRDVLDLRRCLEKKTFCAQKEYNLHRIVSYDAFVKKPVPFDPVWSNPTLPNECINERYPRIRQSLLYDLSLLHVLITDTGFIEENISVANTQSTLLTRIVNGGQTVPCFNTFMEFVLKNGYYLNENRRYESPIRFNILEYPPTFPDPGEHPLNVEYRHRMWMRPEMTDLRQKKEKQLRKKRQRSTDSETWSQLKRKRESVTQVEAFLEADEGEKEGGSVLRPSPGAYKKSRVLIKDFASLYPSVIIAYNICYSTLVFDRDMLNLPGVIYLFVQVSAHETVCFATVPGTQGVYPLMEQTLIQKRREVKEIMKVEKDPHQLMNLNYRQTSLKTSCNGAYGFLGADTGSKFSLPVKEMMISVTSIGRYLQRKCARYLAETYGLITIYGDTDSIFVLIEVSGSLEEVITHCRDRYSMGDSFTWTSIRDYILKLSKGNVDVDTFSEYDHQVNAVVYVVSDRLCKELTSLFPQPVEMEFENLATEVCMNTTKKSYFYKFWKETDPSQVKKIKATGVAHVRRDWTDWTRNSLKEVMNAILEREPADQLINIIRRDVSRLLRGEVPREELVLTKGVEPMSSYKSFEAVHLNVVNRLMSRKRLLKFPEGVRIPYLIVNSGDTKKKLWEKGESPEVVAQKQLPLDYVYYLNNQYFGPMEKYLQFNHIARGTFERLKSQWLRQAQNAALGITGFHTFRQVSDRGDPSTKRNTGPPPPTTPHLKDHVNTSSTASTSAKHSASNIRKRYLHDLYSKSKKQSNPFQLMKRSKTTTTKK